MTDIFKKRDKLTDNPTQNRKVTAGDIRRAMAGGTAVFPDHLRSATVTNCLWKVLIDPADVRPVLFDARK